MTPFVNGLLTFSTCHPSTSYDTVVQAYFGNECEFLTPIDCVDDTAGVNCDNGCMGSGSMVSFEANAGTTYFFQVSTFDNNSAGCPLCLGVLVSMGADCGENPSDFCQIPRVLPGSPGTHTVAMDVATATPDTSMTCSSNPGHTVWFEVTPEISGPVEFSTCTPQTTYDTVVQVWIPGDEACGVLASLGCVDDTIDAECENACSGRGSVVSFDGEAGTTYLFQVGSFNANVSMCDLCLGATLTIAECDADTDCDDANPCTDDACDPAGLCVYLPDDSNTCADVNICNGEEFCFDGFCQPAVPPDCDDNNLCTDDACDPEGGCHNDPNSDPCEDGDACTIDDQCAKGFCQSGDPLDCDDGDTCNGLETCSGGDCIPGVRMNCDDGVFCNGTEPCRGNTCLPGTSPCTVGQVCDEGSTACRADCDVNGIADEIELESGSARDYNANGVIDACENLLPRTLAGLRLLEADSLVPPKVRFENGRPAFATMRVPVDPAAAGDLAVASGRFLHRYNDLYGIADTAGGLYLRRIEEGETQHLYWGQHQNGIPVQDVEIVVHLRDGHIVATYGTYVAALPLPIPRPIVSPIPIPQPIAEAPARTLSLAAAPAVGSHIVVAPRLVYYNAAILGGTPDETVLAWRASVRGFRMADGAGAGWTVFLNAYDGSVLEVLDETREGKDYDLSTAVNDTSANCWFWPHSDSTVQWFTESGPTSSYPGGPSNYPGGDADGDQMFRFTDATYNFFRNTFGRRSYDDDDEQIEAYAHVGVSWQNAAANSLCLFFGDGWVTRDIYGHEWTHSMIFETADLEYKNQSGALNESYADVFGTFIDNDDFFIGEDLSGFRGCASSVPRGALRSLANPPLCGDPDHMRNFSNTTDDNGGVHTNSGIPNKAAYLMLDGGTHNNIIVARVARRKVMRLYYQVINYELTRNSSFMDARDATVRVARQWSTIPTSYGFTPQDACNVINAFASVKSAIAFSSWPAR